MNVFARYVTHIFDCDGVILNSNKIKTEAFYRIASAYGQKAAQTLVAYHVDNGGVSRYQKIEYFLTKILGKEFDESENNELLFKFSHEVKKGLMSCEISKSLSVLRDRVADSRWLVVSGGDQEELREVFEERGISNLFDGGIFGSPDAKDIILERELKISNINMPALFVGDSKYDYEVSKNSGMDFLFVSAWSEVHRWDEWVKAKSLSYINSLDTLI